MQFFCTRKRGVFRENQRDQGVHLDTKFAKIREDSRINPFLRQAPRRVSGKRSANLRESRE